MSHSARMLDQPLRRAALYARVSTEEQAMHGVSLDAQRERLLQYATENGMDVVGVYVDEGISARKRYTARPSFLRMLEDVRAQKIDIILFVKLDRWFRNVADYYEVQAVLDRHRVMWIATEEDYDTTSANGRLALNIKLAIAQDEADRTSERIKFVFSNMIKEGRVISGKTPLGYRIENKRAVIDEQSAPIVRALFDAYIDTRSQKAAAREIFSRFGIHLDGRAVKHMLTNPWYIGRAYGRQNFCPPIIDDKQWALAASLLATRSERHANDHPERVYLFSGLLFCKTCGKRLTTYSCSNKNADGSVRQSFVYYRCPGHVQRQCQMRRQINQDVLEKELLSILLLQGEGYFLEAISQKKPPSKNANDSAQILGKIEKLADLYLNNLIPRSVYEKEYAALHTSLQQAEQAKSVPTTIPSAPRIPKSLSEAYSMLTPERKKAFWSRTIERITVGPEGDAALTFR